MLLTGLAQRLQLRCSHCNPPSRCSAATAGPRSLTSPCRAVNVCRRANAVVAALAGRRTCAAQHKNQQSIQLASHSRWQAKKAALWFHSRHIHIEKALSSGDQGTFGVDHGVAAAFLDALCRSRIDFPRCSAVSCCIHSIYHQSKHGLKALRERLRRRCTRSLRKYYGAPKLVTKW